VVVMVVIGVVAMIICYFWGCFQNDAIEHAWMFIICQCSGADTRTQAKAHFGFVISFSSGLHKRSENGRKNKRQMKNQSEGVSDI